MTAYVGRSAGPTYDAMKDAFAALVGVKVAFTSADCLAGSLVKGTFTASLVW